jgi:hypothetical protein
MRLGLLGAAILTWRIIWEWKVNTEKQRKEVSNADTPVNAA